MFEPPSRLNQLDTQDLLKNPISAQLIRGHQLHKIEELYLLEREVLLIADDPPLSSLNEVAPNSEQESHKKILVRLLKAASSDRILPYFITEEINKRRQ